MNNKKNFMNCIFYDEKFNSLVDYIHLNKTFTYSFADFAENYQKKYFLSKFV